MTNEQKMREALLGARALLQLEGFTDENLILKKIDMALALQPAAGVTVLPDGSAFSVASYPLPKDHWLYAEPEYLEGSESPTDLPAPILTHALRKQVVAAVRYAVRGATMRGMDTDFDPDALVQNAVYALCGPFGGKS